MKRWIIAFSIFAIGYLSFPTSARAILGISLGAEAGMANYSGDILPASGDLGTATQYGVVLGFGALPVFDLQVRARYTSKMFDYTYTVGGVPYSTRFEYQDASAIALLTADVFAPPLSPLGFYVGGGMGLHVMNTDVALGVLNGSISPDQADNPLSLLDRVSRMSALAVAGLRISPPIFPLAIFGEASYESVFGAPTQHITRVGGGLLLRF